MSAGMTVLPVRSTRVAPGGTFASPSTPTQANRPPSTMNAAFSIAGRPSPTMRRAPENTVPLACAGACAPADADHEETATVAMSNRIARERMRIAFNECIGPPSVFWQAILLSKPAGPFRGTRPTREMRSLRRTRLHLRFASRNSWRHSWQNIDAMMQHTTRRDFLALLSALPVAGLAVPSVFAQQKMPARPIPATGEMLPIVGFGSSKVVEETAKNGVEPLRQVLRVLVAQGGKVVDTWPRNAENDARFGTVINEAEFRDRLFVTSKIDRVGKEAGVAQLTDAQRAYGRKTIDLAQIFSLTDLETHWPTLREWKDSGRARYIGVTVSQDQRHAQLEAFLKREKPDFTQVNYSITERLAEERIIPLAADRGIAIVINRPFMNGALFQRLEGKALPQWAADFGCRTWAQFSLKYILSNPRVTCVLTETSNPKHMEENAQAGFGPMPDEATRKRMRDFIVTV